MDVTTARLIYRVKTLIAQTGLLKLPIVDRLRPRTSKFSIDLNGIKLTAPKRFFPHYVLNEYEPVTQQSFNEALRPGMTMVDVGAHIGYYALLSARLVGPGGKVHAIEPFSENLDFLRRNVRANQLTNVDIHPYAAGEERAKRQFHITGSSDSNGFFAHPMTETVSMIEVDQVPVDQVVSGRVDAAKIDVEGAEVLVLNGMTRILSENPGIVLWVEWAPHCMKSAGYRPEELPNRLRALGFTSIEVLDDADGSRRPLDEVLPLVVAGQKPAAWYSNLLARRA